MDATLNRAVSFDGDWARAKTEAQVVRMATEQGKDRGNFTSLGKEECNPYRKYINVRDWQPGGDNGTSSYARPGE
jgi:hypothetical protein